MQVKIWPWLFKIPPFKGHQGAVIGRWIIMAYHSDGLLKHEMVHQKQMDRLTVLGFYCLYFFYWVRGLIKYRDKRKAYRENPLKKEAYGDKE